MALLNENGNYLRVYQVEPYNQVVTIEVWESKEHRDSGGDEFHRPIITVEYVPFDMLNSQCNEGESLLEHLKRAAYEALKQMPKYERCLNC